MCSHGLKRHRSEVFRLTEEDRACRDARAGLLTPLRIIPTHQPVTNCYDGAEQEEGDRH